MHIRRSIFSFVVIGLMITSLLVHMPHVSAGDSCDPAAAANTELIQEYVLPEGICAHYITEGPDNTVWFQNLIDHTKIGKVSASGATTMYTISELNSDAHCFMLGPDSNLWAATKDNRMAKIASNGEATYYDLPTGVEAAAKGCAVGPDNNIWIVHLTSTSIHMLKMAPANGQVLDSYDIRAEDASNDNAGAVSKGPGNKLWFFYYAGNDEQDGDDDTSQLVSIDTSGTMVRHDWSNNPFYQDVLHGDDTALWYASNDYGKVVKIAPNGTPSFYQVPGNGDAYLYGGFKGADGNRWFIAEGSNADDALLRVTDSGVITSFALPSGSSVTPSSIGADNLGNIWFGSGGKQKISKVTLYGAPDEPVTQKTITNAVTSKSVVIQTPQDTDITCSGAQKEVDQNSQDNGFDYPLGLVNFCFTTEEVANQVEVTFVTDLKPEQVSVRKYNPTTKTYAAVTGATVTQTSVQGQAAVKASYNITDNGPLDVDEATGTIHDPIGLAVAAETGIIPVLANTGAVGVSITILLGLIIASSLVVYFDYRKHKKPLAEEDPAAGARYTLLHHVRVVSIPLLKYRLQISAVRVQDGSPDGIHRF